MALKNWIEELKTSPMAACSLMKASPKLREAFQLDAYQQFSAEAKTKAAAVT